MSKTRALCVALLLISTAACESASPLPSAPSTVPQATAPTLTLSGVISRSTPTGGAPLEGAEVWAGQRYTTTDGNGYYSIPELTASTSEIFVTRYPYKSERRTLTLTGDTRLDVQLVRLPRYSLSGVVSELTSTGLVPIEGALVTGSFDNPVTTDSAGFFEIPGGVYKSYDYDHHLVVMKEGYQDFSTTLPLDGDTRLDVQLVRR